MTAACWPGARKNRGLGICKDGMTTCVRTAEVALAWGPCVGYVLPQPGASGAAACECFSHGLWAIDNLSPCFIDSGGGLGSAGAVSTELDVNKMAQCPMPAGTQSSQPWSPDTVSADCSGHFKLCYSLKAGDSANPQPTDCELVKVCSEADYVQVNMSQPFPDLPSWKSTNVACATQFAASGGYGEMSVSGITVMCDMLDKVFNRVKYCPLKCNSQPPPMPTPPECMNCMQGGSGQF